MESIIDRVFNIIDTNNILGLRTLLEDGLDPNIKVEKWFRRTALMIASQEGRNEIVRLLLEYNADPNITDYEGETALGMAALLDRLDNEGIVKTLLEYNADPNLQNVNGNTPLIKATIFNQIYIVHLLLDNGADPFMKNIRGDTALDLAQIYFVMGDVDREVIDLLKNRMATIRLQSRHRGRKTRHSIRTQRAEQQLSSAILPFDYKVSELIGEHLSKMPYHPAVTQRMIQEEKDKIIHDRRKKKTQKKKKKKRKKRFYGGSNNLKGGMFSLPTRLKYTEVEPDFSVYDTNVLKRAVVRGNIKVLRRFIENGINLDFKYKSLNGYSSNTLLITASENGYTDIVELLLKNGASPDIYNSADTTALMEACHNQHPLIVELLLRHGADPNIFYKKRRPTALILAVNKDDIKITELLLEYNADPNFRLDGNGDTPLMFASRRGNTEIATLLLERGANPNILKLDTDGSNNTALIMAAMKNEAPMVELLLEYNADPNLKNSARNHTGSLHDIYFGSTALHWASMEENYDIIKLLLENGADPNIMNIRFKTPLYISVKNGDFNAVKIMLEHNGDATEIFDGGETLLYIIASRYEDKNDIAKLLIEHGVDINAQNTAPAVAPPAGFAQNRLGNTALHRAILRYNIDLVRILLENGADPYIINNSNENSLEYAEDLKQYDINDGLNYDDIDIIIDIIKTYMSVINIQKTFRGRQTRNKLKTELAEKQLVQAKLPFGFQESELIGKQLRSLYPSSIRS